MRQISIVQARSNRGVFACWVYKQGLRRGEERGWRAGKAPAIKEGPGSFSPEKFRKQKPHLDIAFSVEF